MQFLRIRMLLLLAVLFIPGVAWTQEKVEREAVIHTNVKLIIVSPEKDLPEGIQKQYHDFLPMFEKVLKENTSNQSIDCQLTIRILPGMKEVGAAKIQRPLVRVTAFRRNSRLEFVATLLLYSYASAGPVNEEETAQFLKKQILEPAECNAESN